MKKTHIFKTLMGSILYICVCVGFMKAAFGGLSLKSSGPTSRGSSALSTKNNSTKTLLRAKKERTTQRKLKRKRFINCTALKRYVWG